MLTTEFWRKYFRVYDVLNLVIPYRELLEQIVSEAEIKGGEMILDAGVGTGNLALLLEKKGAKVAGLDFSQAALDIYKSKNPEAKTILADLSEKLPFADENFDIVVSNNTLYNIPRVKRLEVVLELKRILRLGGKIILSNVHKGFKPTKIYSEAIRKNIKAGGFLNTLKLILKMAIPTIKMFYYNFIIQKEYKFSKNNLFDFYEQKELLKKAGFRFISETEIVYGGQAVLNVAEK